MPRSILASLTGLGSDRAVMETAIAAARVEGGHVTCLNARIDAIQTAAMMEVTFPQHRHDEEMLRRIGREEAERASAARAVFEESLKRHGLPVAEAPGGGAPVTLSWRESQSFLYETVEEARYHDLVVMAEDEALPDQRIQHVLMQSGRPLLLAPARPLPVLGRSIAIAWKAGAEAARAVSAASSWLARAERVFILSVCGAKDERSRASAERLAVSLAWSGIKAEVRAGHGASAEAKALEDMAYGCEADLLVMGAYGHSRMREWVFGGVTQEMLAGCAIPLLMVH